MTSVKTDCRIINQLGDDRLILEVYHWGKTNVGGVRVSKQVIGEVSKTEIEYRWEPTVEELDEVIKAIAVKMQRGEQMRAMTLDKGSVLNVSGYGSLQRIFLKAWDATTEVSIRLPVSAKQMGEFYEALKLLSRLMKGESA